MMFIFKMDMDQSCFIYLIFIGIFVNAERRMVQIESLNAIPLQGRISTIETVNSLLECAIICDADEDCTTTYYNTSTRLCYTVYNQTDDILVHEDIFGTVYKTRENKTCSYSGYEYIWELDICVMFYPNTHKLNWEDSNTRCQTEEGSLIILNSLLKDILFIPHLLQTREKLGISRWWIGSNDIESEGNFTWISGQPMIYTNWNMDQPDDRNSIVTQTNADCVLYFFRSIEQSFAWFDRTCDTLLASVCENRAFVES